MLGDTFKRAGESSASNTSAGAVHHGTPAPTSVTEEFTISDAAFQSLLDPTIPGPLAMLQHERAVAISFSRSRRKRPSESAGSSTAEEGARVVRLCGPAPLVQHARRLFDGNEAVSTAALAAKAQEARRALTPEEALYHYYRQYYEQAGLPYAQPAALWQDEVTAEANRYKLWASYYSCGPTGGIDSQHAASNAAAAAVAAAAAAAASSTAAAAVAAAPVTAGLSYPDASGLIGPTAPPGPSLSLPPGWIEEKDMATGRHYYCNPSLSITQWERPAGEAPAAADQLEEMMPLPSP